jgi:hypothetical protein
MQLDAEILCHPVAKNRLIAVRISVDLHRQDSQLTLQSNRTQIPLNIGIKSATTAARKADLH